MSAKSEHIHVPEVKNKIPKILVMTAAILSPIFITILALYIFGMHIRNEERIFPNVYIAGIDVSGMTRSEAMQSLDLHIYDERIENSGTKVIFPDDSSLMISGNDVGMHHNARDIVNEAYTVGRGQGVIADVISFLRRTRTDDVRLFDISIAINSEILDNIVGLNTAEYNNRLNTSEPEIFEDRIVFTKGVGHVTADSNEIYELAYAGIFKSLDTGEVFEITYKLPETNKFVTEILDVLETVYVEMISSEFDIESVSATESAIGVNFDTLAAVELIRDTETGKKAVFYLDFSHPEYSREHLDSLLFRDLLGRRETWAHGDSNRLNNINLASEAVNGYILLPDEEFSFNGVVGQRTAERGYRPAPSLSQGETITTIGGGICQTSSTIYAAIRPTDLLVTEQQRHGRPVPYLPWGWDATVFWNFIDFKFVNNTNYPIRIDARLEGRDVIVEVWGTIINDFPIAEGWND